MSPSAMNCYGGRVATGTTHRIALAILLSVSLCLCGCQPPPATDADDIVAYLRNAKAGAKVRSLSPHAQAYAGEVFRAYHAWRQAQGPIVQLAEPEALWAKRHDRWRDPEAVSERLRTIQTWRDEAECRQQSRTELVNAIRAVPLAFQDQATRISSELEQLLVDSEAQRLDRLAGQYQSLLSLVERGRDDFDPQETGLAFRVPEIDLAADRAWQELYQDQLQEMQWMMTEGKRLRDEAIEKKRNLRSSSSDGQQRSAEIRKLDIDIHYYDQMIDQAEKQRRKDEARRTKDEG